MGYDVKKPMQVTALTQAEKKESIEDAVVTILHAMGQDLESPDLKETPTRVAKYLLSYSAGKVAPKITTFADASEGQVVVVKDLDVRSMCAHHMLPFFGKATIAYIPNGQKAGLSKFQRTVDYIAEQPQDQEKVTKDLVDFLYKEIQPTTIYVKLDCQHTCMIIRGIKTAGSTTTTLHKLGKCTEAQEAMILKMMES